MGSQRLPKVNILIFSKHYSPEPFLIHNISTRLKIKNTNVYVLTSQPSYPGHSIYKKYSWYRLSYEMLDNIHIYRVPTIPRIANNFFAITINYICFFFFAMFLGIFLSISKNIKIIFVYATSPMLQAFFAIPARFFSKAKMVVWLQDLSPQDIVNNGFLQPGFIFDILSKAADFIYKKSDLLLVQSVALKKSISKLYWNKIIFFPNPIDLTFSRNVPKNKHHLVDIFFKKDKFYITCAGNIGISQDIDSLVAVARIFKSKKMDKFHFLIFGSGSRLSYLREELSKYELKNITLAGSINRFLMPYVYMKSNCLFSSLLNKETFQQIIPYRIHDYLSSGKPLVTAINGATYELIKNYKLGVACSAQNPKELANAFVKVSAFKAKDLKDISNNSLNYCRNNLDIDKNCSILLKIFRELIK
jgi:glycosyltransferase involved in cell wall biosynthesis